MSEVPEDVMDAARNACNLCGVTPTSDMRVHAEHVAAVAIEAERNRIAAAIFDRPAFMTAVSGDGKPYVKIEFDTTSEMQNFYGLLVDLSKAAKK